MMRTRWTPYPEPTRQDACKMNIQKTLGFTWSTKKQKGWGGSVEFYKGMKNHTLKNGLYWGSPSLKLTTRTRKLSSWKICFVFGIRPTFGCDIVGFRECMMFNYVTIPVHQPVMFNRSDCDLEHCVIWFCQKKVPGPSLKQTAKESLESWKANPFCLVQLSWRKEGSEVRLRWSDWMETSKPWDSSPLNHLLDPFGRIVWDLFPSMAQAWIQ